MDTCKEKSIISIGLIDESRISIVLEVKECDAVLSKVKTIFEATSKVVLTRDE